MIWIESVWNYTLALPMNGYLAIFLYWIPMALCAIGYTRNCVDEYYEDVKAVSSSDGKFYSQKLRVGTIVWRICVTLIPVANLFALVFRHLHPMCSMVFEALVDVLSTPIVKKKEN